MLFLVMACFQETRDASPPTNNERSIREYVQKLADDDVRVRERAVEALKALEPSNLPVLMNIMGGQNDPEVRERLGGVIRDLEDKIIYSRMLIEVKAGKQAMIFVKIDPRNYRLEYPPFYMQDTEVTNAQYKEFLTDTKRSKDDKEVLDAVKERERSRTFSTGDVPMSVKDENSIWKNGDYPEGQDEHPVTIITYGDVEAFCGWLSEKHSRIGLFRLPTWNEWMIAAYGGNRAYPWGDKWEPSRIHMSYGFEYPHFPKRTEPVRTRKDGKTPEGLYGMYGNASEYIDARDPTNKNYFDIGARWMGGGFVEGRVSKAGEGIDPRRDYWGYSHHKECRQCDLGFRVLLDPKRDSGLIDRPRIFGQKDKTWLMEK